MHPKIKKIITHHDEKYKTVAIIILVLATSIITSTCAVLISNHFIRQARINDIFSSLKIDESKYMLTGSSILTDKKTYGWDSSRSFSSYKNYVRGATVSETIKELESAIAGTDFTFYEEPYPGSMSYMHIYRSPRNEYIRISIESKSRADEFFNKYKMGLSVDTVITDPNTGPSDVIIKVNLDDNNE